MSDFEDLELRMSRQVANCLKNRVYRKAVWNVDLGRHESYCVYHYPGELNSPFRCPYVGGGLLVRKSVGEFSVLVSFLRCLR